MGAGGAENVEAMIGKLEQLKVLIDQVHNQIRDPEKTTFVCVCIPEFLSIYETERLVQELSKSEIDTHNVVVNQVLFPDKDAADLIEWYKTAKDTLPQEAQDLIGTFIYNNTILPMCMYVCMYVCIKACIAYIYTCKYVYI